MVVDIVTDRRANLHAEIVTPGEPETPSEASEGMYNLYAAAYRPVERDDEPKLDIWLSGLAVGTPLPLLPLWLPGSLCLPVDLEATYERTCRDMRIPAPSS
jgi:hypothetical protein